MEGSKQGRKEAREEEIESKGKVIIIKKIQQIRKKSGRSVREEVREGRLSNITILDNQ